MPDVKSKTVIFDREDGNGMRALARDLATASGKCWERLSFGEIVYWLHRAKSYADVAFCSVLKSNKGSVDAGQN